ncbi:two-component system, NtrC family, sensor histidine kinase PilS [Steroidobacter denitrificans]|uniref:histidine kinase n=1 Tax=Steroidobacter denitrificans TaxID=465721 RepID=A0A127FBK9_STEDE|nr:HAMP domain-containing sensor histidine kinase [Steroidobacter denitrificans]AMN47803.1 two-component system, NtrC family, sensor histidine kinase PilS [Steroidobacter denitrificans]
MNAPADPPAPAPPADLGWRVLALINLFRLLTPLLLALIFAALDPAPVGTTFPALFIGTTATYFAYAVVSIAGVKRRWPEISVQTIVSVCVDIVAIGILTYASGGMASGLAVLMVLPIGVASFIVRPQLALLLASLAAIALVAQQIFIALAARGEIGDLTSAGIAGALLLLVTLGVGRLAGNLRDNELRLRQREVDVADLAQLNQFIVQHLRESILVVDANDTIRLINESAAQLLHSGPVAPGTLLGEISPRLIYLLGIWRRHPHDWQLSSLSMPAHDGGNLLQPHFVSLDSSHGPTLIFLEDTTLMAERVQQSKLAALGRLSASIAHEIRNPVGAMSHAAQLLAETPGLSPQEQRFAEIIIRNGARVSTIIENVLQLSRRDSTRQQRLELNDWLRGFLVEFRDAAQLPEAALSLHAPGVLDVRIDPSHLHQLMWNLCENAIRHGRHDGCERNGDGNSAEVDDGNPAEDGGGRDGNDSEAAGQDAGTATVEIRSGRIAGTDRPFVEVLDRGKGIPAEDTERVFEPFFTSGKGGTGLGLFIARELAQCNRALLLYEPRPGGGSIFRLVFSDPQRWEIQ